jgi:ubiquinone/menaquinone biosynthesis C-methylase UbiE
MKRSKSNIGSVCLAQMIMILCIILTTYTPCFGQVDRETWQPPEKIMDSIGVKPGMRIGEAGAGHGYFTFPLARRVGSGGMVFANDISVDGLDAIKERAVREGLKNIRIVVGEVENPLFPEKNLDMVVMVYVLHEVERPIPFLKNLQSYLKPGGLLVIIENTNTAQRGHIPPFLTKSQIIEMAGETGYELDRIETFLTRDNICIFKKPTNSTY